MRLSTKRAYYHQCRELAGENVHFIDHLPQEELIQYYQKAKVHVLPSWFETCGLSTLEAAAMHCNIVITDKGFAHEYFNDCAFYCDPSSPSSILGAIDKASKADHSKYFNKKFSLIIHGAMQQLKHTKLTKKYYQKYETKNRNNRLSWNSQFLWRI